MRWAQAVALAAIASSAACFDDYASASDPSDAAVDDAAGGDAAAADASDAGAPPTVRGSSEERADSSSTVTLAIPAGARSGDLMWVAITNFHRSAHRFAQIALHDRKRLRRRMVERRLLREPDGVPAP